MIKVAVKVMKKTTSIEIQFFSKNNETLVTYSANTTIAAAIKAAKRDNILGVGFFNGRAFWIIYKEK